MSISLLCGEYRLSLLSPYLSLSIWGPLSISTHSSIAPSSPSSPHHLTSTSNAPPRLPLASQHPPPTTKPVNSTHSPPPSPYPPPTPSPQPTRPTPLALSNLAPVPDGQRRCALSDGKRSALGGCLDESALHWLFS